MKHTEPPINTETREILKNLIYNRVWNFKNMCQYTML